MTVLLRRAAITLETVHNYRLRLITHIKHALAIFVGIQKLVRLIGPRCPAPQAQAIGRSISTTLPGVMLPADKRKLKP